MGFATTVAAPPVYTAVPLAGLAGPEALPFPLFLQTSPNTWVLYRDRNAQVGEDHLQRMAAEEIGRAHV